MSWLSNLFGGVSTQESDDAYNELKEQEYRDHDAGYDAGGPVDTTGSESYQFGQHARMEDDDPYYCGICGVSSISTFPHRH
jgi:hypothetical protein